MKHTPLYRIEVAPLVIISLSKAPYFSYASPVPIKKGSLVTVSFGPRTIEGVVFDCQALPGPRPSWMKEITQVKAEAFLTEQQCHLAAAISDEYFTPLGKTIKHFLPKQVRSRTLPPTLPPTKKLPLRATKEESTLLKKLTLAKQGIACYIDTSLMDDPKRISLLIGKQTAKTKKQTLILVPEITLIPGLASRFQACCDPQTVAILHSKLSPGVFFATWERIRSGQALIILATRQGLFAPFHNLGTIIVTEEQDESYKQWDMSPRYHGKRVAALLASLSHSRLILLSGTPSVESLKHIQEKKLLPLQSIPTHSALGNALTIVNLKLERYHKNFSPLSLPLIEALRNTLTRGEQALLHINRQGMNAFSVCDQCKNVFRCPQCHHPLTSTKAGHFRCAHCSYITALFPNCPTCGHLAFRHIGFGTEKVEKEVLKLFPKAKVARLDSGTLKTAETLSTLYQNGMTGTIDILVGTQMILKDPPLPSLTLVAMIDADSLLLFPDFQADERLFQNLSRATRQVTTKGKVVVQTFHPESAFFQKVTTTNSEAFLKQVLMEREELFYPPFSRLITLICQDKNEKDALKKSAALYSTLQAVLPTGYRLQPPSPIRFLKKQSLFESALLLRFPATNTLTTIIKKILIKESKDCIIDVDPLTLH